VARRAQAPPAQRQLPHPSGIGNATGVDPQYAPGTLVRSLANGSAETAGSAIVGQAPGVYALRGVYFRREWYMTQAECLTAAYALGVPLNICH
jgi:hypothetical protein